MLEEAYNAGFSAGLKAPRPAEAQPQTSEAYFADRDRFVRFVREQVNPAREAEELSTVTPALAEHLYDVIQQRRYCR